MTHSETIKNLNKTAREEMDRLLSQCTEAQQNLFSRMYPNGVPDSRVDQALSQIERTLNKELRI